VRNRTLPFTIASFCAVLFAQDQLSVWRIEVRGAGVTAADEYIASLENLQHQKVAATDLRPDNYFEFHNVPYGDYWMTVTDEQDRTVYAGMVTAHAGGWQEALDLSAARRKHGPDSPPAGPISVANLRHPPSRKAYKAFMDAQQLAQNGQFAEATAQLEKAIRLSPDWPEAHTNLAANYLRLGQFEESITEARRSIQLNKPNAIDLGNISYAEYRLNRRGDAIEAARAGLQADPGSPKLHYLLGSLLALDPSTRRESIAHLELAARTLPAARQNLEAARRELR
jgi:tetratricopeptide (TPR) repeat protein